MEKMYVLVKEYLECGNGLKEVDILNTSFDKRKLEKEIQKIKEDDLCRFFKRNGILTENEWCLESHSDEGFLRYYITFVPHFN